MPPKSKANPILTRYFRRIAEAISTGGVSPEMSYYPAIEELCNELGRELKPAVFAVSQPEDIGAGRPDFALYSRDGTNRAKPGSHSRRPDRGVIEVKSMSEDIDALAESEQVKRYLAKYGAVMITNIREFKFIRVGDTDIGPEIYDYVLSSSENQFRKMIQKPKLAGEEHGAGFAAFFKQAMMSATPLRDPEEIAEALAFNASEALKHIEKGKVEIPGSVRDLLEALMGIKFQRSHEHFLRSTLIQTLFYGIFSAWVDWARSGIKKPFDWCHTDCYPAIPAIRALFGMIAAPYCLTEMGIKPMLDRTGNALARIDKKCFLDKFDQSNEIHNFYELFLSKFDPVLRKELGVWYTPPEIVKYMVERVDRVLREELDIRDGLANPSVRVLDPCCGTGAYLVGVLNKIAETMKAKHKDDLVGQEVKEAAKKRVFGFEIMPAPFIIAHWQVGSLLAGLKVPMDYGQKERAAIYLTNSLSGWGDDSKPRTATFPEIDEEREKAGGVKHDKKIIVILGNPPYNAHAGTSPDEEEDLTDPYLKNLRKCWGITKHGIGDSYVKFFRIAERQISNSGQGIVSYISNHSWTFGRSYVEMRRHLLDTFNKVWIENMHGSNRHGSARRPGEKSSQSIFRLEGYTEGIRQGVVISLLMRGGAETKSFGTAMI